MLGAAIAAGASLISGLFGKSDAEKQAKKEEKAIKQANAAAAENANRMNWEARTRADAAALVPVMTERETSGSVDMGAFLQASEEAGINPISMLRSGALSLFATTQDWSCTTGERAMDAAQAGQYIPQLATVQAQTRVPGMGEVLGNALTSGANQFLSDKSIAENNAFQMQMLERQMVGVSSPGAYAGSRSGYVPKATLSGAFSKTGGGELAGGRQKTPYGDTPVPYGPLRTSYEDLKASVIQGWQETVEVWRKDPGVKNLPSLNVRPPARTWSPVLKPAKKVFRPPTRPGQQHRYGPGGNL